MTIALKAVGAITLFIADLPRAVEFYRRLTGDEPIFTDEVSTVFKFDNTIINLLLSSEAAGLVAPAAVAAAGAGAQCQYTIWVEDTDAACAQLGEVGVALLNGPVDREWGMRTAAFADPDGNVWELAQELK